jgi:citrate lyase beta subunit
MTYYSDSEGGHFLIKCMLWPIMFLMACAAAAAGDIKPMLKVFGVVKDEEATEEDKDESTSSKAG